MRRLKSNFLSDDRLHEALRRVRQFNDRQSCFGESIPAVAIAYLTANGLHSINIASASGLAVSCKEIARAASPAAQAS